MEVGARGCTRVHRVGRHAHAHALCKVVTVTVQVPRMLNGRCMEVARSQAAHTSQITTRSLSLAIRKSSRGP